MLLSSINKSEVGLMTSEVWKVATSYTNKLRAGLTTRDVPSAADTMENIQEWEEAGWEERSADSGCDVTQMDVGREEDGDTKVMGWWHLILGGAQHCHLVSYCQHHRFTKDRLTNIGCLLNMVVSLSFRSLSKTENFGQMSWWCWVTSVFCGYQKTIIELIFPLASVFCWLSNVTLWCIDNGMDGGFLILRLGENWGESLIPRWWHLVGGELRWELREPTLTNSFLIIIYKGEKWECHHDGREWVMSQYFDGLPLPGDRWPPEEFDLKYFWRSELFFMNQVLSHIIRRNETMGDRGAVTLRWSMGDWSELMTSRDVLLQTWDNFNFHCFKLSNLTSVSYWHN